MQLIDFTETVVIKGSPIPVRTLRWDYSEEIARGSKFLDDRFGTDWHHDLDLEDLDLHSGYSCVLGQLAMTRFREQLVERGKPVDYDSDCDCAECKGTQRYEYSDVTRLLSEQTDDARWQYHSSGNPATHGFFVDEDLARMLIGDLPGEDQERLMNAAWEQLTWAWMDEIRLRREVEKKAAKVHEEADKLLAEERQHEEEFTRELKEAVPA